MRDLVEKIKKMEGRTFTGLANSFENTIDELAFCIQQIALHRKIVTFTFPESPWSAALKQIIAILSPISCLY